VVAVVAIGWAVRPLVPAGTLRLRRGLPAVVGYRGLIGATYVSAEVYLPLLLTQRFGLSPSAAGLVLTAGAITWSSTSWLQGRLGAKGPDVLMIRVGTVLLGSAVVMAILTAVLSLHPAVAIVSWGLAGGGMGLMYPRLSVLLLRYADPSEQGFSSSAGQIMEFTGMAVALAATGAVFAALIGSGSVVAYVAPFAFSLLLAVVAVLHASRVWAVVPPATAAGSRDDAQLCSRVPNDPPTG
jgi:MFS family permease